MNQCQRVEPSEKNMEPLLFGAKPPCYCRVRISADTLERASCAGRLGAFRKNPIREYVKTRGEHVIEPTIDTTLDSLGEAYYFYNMYSWEH